MSTEKLLILSSGEFSFGPMIAAYIKFYSENRIRPCMVATETQHLHPLAIQVMKEDGIDITDLSYDDASSLLYNFQLIISTIEDPEKLLPQNIDAEILKFQFDKPVQSTAYEQVLKAYRGVRENIKIACIEFVGNYKKQLIVQ
jgi:arsenate reductase (thioredoxin)